MKHTRPTITHYLQIPDNGLYAKMSKRMLIGDSVWYSTLDQARTLARAIRRNGDKPVMRNEKGGCRVWRTLKTK